MNDLSGLVNCLESFYRYEGGGVGGEGRVDPLYVGFNTLVNYFD